MDMGTGRNFESENTQTRLRHMEGLLSPFQGPVSLTLAGWSFDSGPKGG